MNRKPGSFRADAEPSPMTFRHKMHGSDNASSVECLNRIQQRRGRRAVPVADRFWSKAAPNDDGCWIWQSTTLRGYGEIALSRKGAARQTRVLAHRMAWELAHGRPVPAGMVVRHICDVSLCVNPAHLLLGTPRDNIADQIQRGRLTFGRVPLPAAGLPQQVGEHQALQPHQDPQPSKPFGVTADLTSEQAVAFLGLPSVYALYRRIRHNGLPHARRGGLYVFKRNELQRWQRHRAA